MANKKKVCLITGILRDGGAQRAACNISHALEDVYDISYVTFSRDNAAYTPAGTVYDLQLPTRKGRIAKPVNEIRRAVRLRKWKKEHMPDVCISFLDDANFPNVVTRGIGMTVTSLRTYLSARPMGRWSAWKIRLSYSKADKVVAVSRDSMDDLLRLGYSSREKCTAIGNMVDGKTLLKGAKIPERDPAVAPVVVTMGSLTAQKGMWNLFRAFREVLREIPEASLEHFGGVPENMKGKYEQLLRDLGIADRVRLNGFVIDPHIRMANADLFVLPSRFEGMPNALLEAMVVGLPVISTDCHSGPREILAPDAMVSENPISEAEYAPYGVLIPTPHGGFLQADEPLTAEEKSMAESIVEMLKDRKRLFDYRRKAMERAAEYSPEIIRKKWIDLIEQNT